MKDKKEKKPTLDGKSKNRKRGEGLYFSDMGKHIDELEREKDIEKITKFIDCVFSSKP
jgi:hypothetical protein